VVHDPCRPPLASYEATPTTAALVLGPLIADTVGPWLLIGVVCTLSRFRGAVLLFIRTVNV